MSLYLSRFERNGDDLVCIMPHLPNSYFDFDDRMSVVRLSVFMKIKLLMIDQINVLFSHLQAIS